MFHSDCIDFLFDLSSNLLQLKSPMFVPWELMICEFVLVLFDCLGVEGLHAGYLAFQLLYLQVR